MMEFYSFQDETPVEATGIFERSKSGGVITVHGISGDNMYPPGPIRDLRVVDTGLDLEMNFTCPGEDLFTGIISQINIYFSNNKTDLQELTPSSNVSTVTQEMINMGDLHPQQPHDVVNLRLSSSFFEAGTSYSFRVMAVDEGEKFSMSNIVSVIPEYVEDVEVSYL